MEKKVMIFISFLLALYAVTPVMATPATKIPYLAEVSLTYGNISPGEQWITKGGILHVKGVICNGTFDSEDLGIFGATMWKKIDYTLNLNTGKGTMHGKFVLTVEGAGTFEGSFRDKITNSTHLSGTVEGQGTGAFTRWKTMGTWYGDIIDGKIENILDAIILSP